MTDIEMLNAENARLTKLVIELRAAMLSAAPAAPQPAQQPLPETEVMVAFDGEADDDDAAPFVFLAGVRFAERKHGIGVKND